MRTENLSAIEDIVHKLVFAPTSNTHLDEATKIAQYCLNQSHTDLPFSHLDPRRFSGGEFCPKFQLDPISNPSLAGKHVYVIVTPGPYKSAEELIQRACMIVFAARENHADKVVVVETDFSHGRQDRGPAEDPKALGELTTVRWRARQYHAVGVDKIITTHSHSQRTSAYFALEYGLIPKEFLPTEASTLLLNKLEVPDHVECNDPKIQDLGRSVYVSIPIFTLLADYLLHQGVLKDSPYLQDEGARLVLKAMDKGDRKFIDNLAGAMFLSNLSKIYCDKLRGKKNDPNSLKIEKVQVSPNFDTLDGKMEILADDGVDTAGTMLNAVEWSRNGNICPVTGKVYGTPQNRIVYVTHAWLGGQGHNEVQHRLVADLHASEFITTNTRPYITDSQYYRFKENSTVLRLAHLWGDAIIANELGHDLEARYSKFSSEQEQHEFISPLYALKRHSQHFLAPENASGNNSRPFVLRD